MPYFDNDTDFSYQFAIILLGIKTYQMLMLTKGYLVRGGIAIGSYYSDDNMIFSGALIEAVSYEKNGSTKDIVCQMKQPRILISPEILKKLEATKIHQIMAEYFKDGIITDNDGEVFVNPFFDSNTSLSVFTNVLSLFPSGENEISSALTPLIRNSLELLGSFIKPESNDLVLDQLLGQMEQKINYHKKEPSILYKYEWVKAFLMWLKAGKQGSTFSICHVDFKEVVEAWNAEQ